MCGILGILRYGGDGPDRTVLQRMSAAIRHRGPDDDGMHAAGPVALGFRRLAIIDLTTGHQPQSTKCGRYTIVFNGEIYNYRDIRACLEKEHGVEFRTTSDTEVLLYAYRQWGADALARLNGMFALAIWDEREQELFLARDRAGKKPLYYVPSDDGLVFCSEIKGLLEHPEVPREIDPDLVPTFLAYRYVPGQETLFRGIRCVPAGSFMRVSRAGTSEPREYWDVAPPRDDRDRLGEAEATSRVEELLRDAVRLRLVADVPVGAYLSGGLDSSLVVALMAKLHPEALRTFSIGFRDGFNEAGFAQTVAQRFGCDHTEVEFGTADMLGSMLPALWARETPITEPSDIPILLLSRHARERVTVVVSGEGADETFAGYSKYAVERQWGRRVRTAPGWAVRAAVRALPFRARGAQLALEALTHRDRFDGYAAWFGGFDAASRARLLGRGDRGDVHAYARSRVSGRRGTAVDEMLYLDFKHWLPANLLLRGDRMTMAASLELRCPFLDYRLVDFCAAELPEREKFDGLRGKRILRRIARKELPQEILERKKWGFKVPIAQWFRRELSNLLRSVLLGERCLARGTFDPARLRALVDDHVAGRRNWEKQLWILLQLELWQLMFVERQISPGDSLSAISAPAAARR